MSEVIQTIISKLCNTSLILEHEDPDIKDRAIETLYLKLKTKTVCAEDISKKTSSGPNHKLVPAILEWINK